MLFADIANVEIDGVPNTDIVSISVDVDDPKTPKKTMTRNRRAKGVTSGVATFPCTMSASIPLTGGTDWQAWCLLKQAKTITFERGDNGKRVTLRNVYVNKVGEKHDEGGDSSYDVDCIALDFKQDS